MARNRNDRCETVPSLEATALSDRSVMLDGIRNVLNEIDEAVFTTELDGTITYVNPAFERITGFDKSTAIGRNPRILKSGEHPTEFYEQLWDTVKDGDIWEEKVINRRKNGNTYLAQQTIIPIGQGNTIQAFVAIQREITSKQFRDRQISVLNRLLRHNLRNELTVIQGSIQNLDGNFGSNEENTTRAYDAIDRLVQLSEKIRELNLYSDPDATRRDLDVSELIKRVTSDDSTESAIAVDRGGVNTITAYPSVELALQELIENATKHTEDGTKISLSFSEDSDQYRITVRDDGPGLSPQELRVLDGSRETQLHHGSGIGLWIVAFVIEQHGGSFAVEDVNTGTSITLEIPRRASDDEHDSLPPLSGSKLETRERYRSIFERSWDGTIVVDANGRITDCNDSTSGLLGLPARELFGRRIDDFVFDIEWSDIAERADTQAEVTIQTHHGDTRTVKMTITEDVVLDQYFLILRDITVRKRRERALNERIKELEAIRSVVEIIDDESANIPVVLEAVAETIRESLAHPDRYAVTITYGSIEITTAEFDDGAPTFETENDVTDENPLSVTLAYVAGDEEGCDDPFPSEEREHVESITQILGGFVERIEHADSLEATTYWYQELLAHSSDFVMVVDRTGVVKYCSPAIERVMGYSSEDVVDTNTFDYIFEEDIDRALTSFSEVIETDDDVTVEYRSVHEDGSIRWLEVRGRNRLDDPVIDGILVNVRDITKRKHRELALEESRERFDTLIEHSSDVITVLDEAGTITYQSPAIEAVLGYESDETIGDPAFEYVHPEDRDEVMEAFAEVSTAPEARTERIEYRFKHADGSWRWIESIGSNQTNSAVEGFVINSRDVTERRRRERALKRSEIILEHSPDTVCIVDAEGVVTFQSHADPDLYDYDPIDLEGSSPTDLIHPDDIDTLIEDMNTLLETPDEIVKSEYRFRMSDGGYRWFENIARNHFDEPNIDGILVGIRDITQRKRLEERLVEQRNNLRLLNEVLRHDIRNDLTIIQGYSELLDDMVDETQQRYLDSVLSVVNDSINLTKTARDLSDMLLEPETTVRAMSIREPLNREIDELREAHPDAEITVDVPAKESIATANEMVESVFRNVLHNAIQHNDSDVPQIDVLVEEGEARIVVRIADNGPGIPDGQKDRVFDRGETGLDSNGTGLGLYLVKTLMQSYGGEVWVEDNEPRGAVVCLAFERGDV